MTTNTISSGNVALSDKQLSPFLTTLARGVEEGKLSPTQLQRVGEFYMSYMFKEDLEAKAGERDTSNGVIRRMEILEDDRGDDEYRDDRDVSSEELFKFLSIGWYVYSLLQGGESG